MANKVAMNTRSPKLPGRVVLVMQGGGALGAFLGRLLPERARARPETMELLSWGCGAVMHVLPLQAPALEGEDHTKDIDFTPGGIRARWKAGREFAQRKIAAAPWSKKIDPAAGILVHA